MLNPIEAYKDAGRRAAIAMNQHDAARYDHERRWFRSAASLEKGAEKHAAEAAYKEGYELARVIPPPSYFH